jgi:hypothetical protein
VTQQHFVVALVFVPFVMAAALWIYAFSLCSRTGRILLTAGLWLLVEPRHGVHEMPATKERPTYEDEPVRIRERRTEDERIAAYANMRAETMELPVTVSAAPYIGWAAELAPTDLDELRASLDSVVTGFHNDLTARLDAVLADVLAEHTGAHRLVAA